MRDLPPEARRRLDSIAARHGVSPDAALVLLRAMAVGKGVMAQFNHPELGGMGQWLRSGMVMVGDMFDPGLKLRVGALSAELAGLLDDIERPPAGAEPGHDASPRGGLAADRGHPSAGAWWPAELGEPASSGAQDGVRYAYFPASRRLAVQRGDRVSLHDTGARRISGVSQGQSGAEGSVVFSSDRGAVRLEDLPVVDAAAEAPPPAPAAPGGDPIELIERLADLHAKGVLTAEEFAAKKAELLARL
jgi:Short C-terminal domain